MKPKSNYFFNYKDIVPHLEKIYNILHKNLARLHKKFLFSRLSRMFKLLVPRY